MIPRRISINTWLVVLAFVLNVVHARAIAGARDEAQRELAEVAQRITYTEGRYTECSFALDRYDTVLTQCLAWQARVSLDLELFGRACAQEGGEL